MAIDFNKETKTIRFLDPFNSFQESQAHCEIRRDPLTGRTGRLAHFVGFKLAACDFSSIIEASKHKCPFCPDRILKKTPKFPADLIAGGRLQRGETVLFPNLFPYDEHNAVAVITQDHFLTLGQFTASQLKDGFLCCIEYFQRLPQAGQNHFAVLSWNYMPPAASSQIHSHFQAYMTKTPGVFLHSLLTASSSYYQTYHRCYWDDLLEEERQRDERLVAQGDHCFWITDFVSQSPLSDVVAIFPGQQTLFDLSQEALDECSEGLVKVFKYLDRCGVYSLNLGWFPGPKDRTDYCLQLRISPRLYLVPKVWCTDTPALTMLYHEPLMFWTPEEVAQGLRDVFSTT